MSVTIGIACEDNGHFVTVTRIVDELVQRMAFRVAVRPKPRH